MNLAELAPNKKGFLEVGDGYSLYWEEWGNPNAKPIFHLHGGPGSGFSDRQKLLYDPKKHRVIFHDQRGAGKSTPFAETENNTSTHLIADIEKLREHLGIEKMFVSGGSWGSTLSLLYAIAHPERVERLMIWSLFLARQFEVDFVNEGTPRFFFPEAWERFIALVPPEDRTTGTSVMKHYAQKMRSEDAEVAKKYANEWTLWEATLLSVNYNSTQIEKMVMEDKENTAIARIETHYFLNQCFVPENYILDNIGRLKDVPCTLVHGRFDMCTPPLSAHDLQKAYGENLSLIWVNSGHYNTDPEMQSALRATALSSLV